VSLYSALSLNKIYLPEAVCLLMLLSPELLKCFECQASLNPVYEIIVFTESDEHTEATNNCMSEHNVRMLGVWKKS
jgi:hypothetical protein